MSLWLTTLWHPFMAAGFWGLHKSQAPDGNTLSLSGTVLVIAGFVIFAPLSVMFLSSGLPSIQEFMRQHQYFLAGALLTVVGMILFATAMLRARYYPAWMAYGTFAAMLLVVLGNAAGLAEPSQHAGFIALSLIVIGMATTALGRLSRASLIAD